VPGELRDKTLTSNWYFNGNHSSIVARYAKLPKGVDPAKIKFDQPLIVARLKAIPVGATFIVGKHAEALRSITSAALQVGYTMLYAKEIPQAEAEFLT